MPAGTATTVLSGNSLTPDSTEKGAPPATPANASPIFACEASPVLFVCCCACCAPASSLGLVLSTGTDPLVWT
uniref:Uncharacterized protein n=1 Tax=Arundo donax TaxID=35708 RepID=A0A0A9D024_ARUDO